METKAREEIANLIFSKKMPFEKAARNKKGAEFVIYRVLGHCLAYTQDVIASDNPAKGDETLLLFYWQLLYVVIVSSLTN